MSDTIVPLAYVTKWATTVGIRIVRDAQLTEHRALMKRGGLYVPEAHWTTDKAIAEGRYRQQIKAAHAAAQRKVAKLAAASVAPPVYSEG